MLIHGLTGLMTEKMIYKSPQLINPHTMDLQKYPQNSTFCLINVPIILEVVIFFTFHKDFNFYQATKAVT